MHLNFIKSRDESPPTDMRGVLVAFRRRCVWIGDKGARRLGASRLGGYMGPSSYHSRVYTKYK